VTHVEQKWNYTHCYTQVQAFDFCPEMITFLLSITIHKPLRSKVMLESLSRNIEVSAYMVPIHWLVWRGKMV